VAAKSFRNLDRVSVLPAPACGVADVMSAASLLLSQAALDALTRRAKGERPDGAAAEPAGEAA
jgi:large subunit ribosomal protein L4